MVARVTTLPVLPPVATPDLAVAATGAGQVLQQFQDKPVFQGLLASYLNRVQELEVCVWEILNARGFPALAGISAQYTWPDAEGNLGLPSFDALGSILGLPRLGLSDTQYSIALQERILVLKSGGTTNDLEGILALGWGLPYVISDGGIACIVIMLDSASVTTTTLVLLLLSPLALARAAGIRLILIYWPQVDSLSFAFNSTSARGWADSTNPSAAAGKMIGALGT